ncbi:hypothetical protein MTBSS4_100094 [Magnetospirillum sp. SS-4]|nr:hypothetical protein MTBSS4_100094 [Magnetospirillum sp. SS-4]
MTAARRSRGLSGSPRSSTLVVHTDWSGKAYSSSRGLSPFWANPREGSNPISTAAPAARPHPRKPPPHMSFSLLGFTIIDCCSSMLIKCSVSGVFSLAFARKNQSFITVSDYRDGLNN